tara:strand:- start:389 stop:553 length:165 start_codon:yes stop_codon:yes gene_type:complete
VDEEEKGNVARQENEEESQKHVEGKRIDADADAGAELIKNNFIYLNFSLIYIKK